MRRRRSGALGGVRRMIARTDANEAERHHEQDEQQDEDEKWQPAPQPDDADHVRNATPRRPIMSASAAAIFSCFAPARRLGIRALDAQKLLTVAVVAFVVDVLEINLGVAHRLP